MNHIVFIVIDSARYDTFRAAKTPNLDRLGKTEKRHSYASWTSPSHEVFLMGLLPHRSQKDTFSSEVFRTELLDWNRRIGARKISFSSFLPEFSLPKALQSLGYETRALVSMPLLNPKTHFSRYFNDYQLMPQHNQFDQMIEQMSFSGKRPKFYFLNLGEAHYPYETGSEPLPHLPGFHGVLRELGGKKTQQQSTSGFFSKKQMLQFKRQQIRCIERIDALIAKLYEKCPPNTHFIVTSDHGELFGEGGMFGHGPVFHPKVFEVPFLEGLVPSAKKSKLRKKK